MSGIAMKSDQKAQVSLELVIIVGLIVIITVTIFPYIMNQSELNKALSAARDGATYAITMRGLGYNTPTGAVSVPHGVIKIKDMRLESTNASSCPATKPKYRIRFNVSVPKYIAENSSYAASIRETIRNYAGSHIYHAFYGRYNATIYGVETERFCFTTWADITSY